MLTKIASLGFVFATFSSAAFAQGFDRSHASVKFDGLVLDRVSTDPNCKVYVNEYKNWPFSKTTDLSVLGDSGFFANFEYTLRSDCKGASGKIRSDAGVTVLGGINQALLTGVAEIKSDRTSGKNNLNFDLDAVGKTLYAKVLEKNGTISDTIHFPAADYSKSLSGSKTYSIQGFSVPLKYEIDANIDGTIMYTISNTKFYAFMGLVNKAGARLISKKGQPGDDNWYEVKGELTLIHNLLWAVINLTNVEGDKWNARGILTDRVIDALKGSLTVKGRRGSTSVDKTFSYPGFDTWETPVEFNKDYNLL